MYIYMSSKHNNDRLLNHVPKASSSSRDSKQAFHSSEDECLPAIKRRRRFTADETKVLEKEYEINCSPNQQKIQAIANSISTPRKIVTTWFQNRRAKHKRKEKLARGEYQEDCDLDIDYEPSEDPTIREPVEFQGKDYSPLDCNISSYSSGLRNEVTPGRLLTSAHYLNQSNMHFQPVMPITHHNQIIGGQRDINNYFLGQDPCFFPYHQPYSNETSLIHNNTRILESQHDFIHHDLNSFLTSPPLKLESSEDDNTLYINPADIYIKQPPDTEQ